MSIRRGRTRAALAVAGASALVLAGCATDVDDGAPAEENGVADGQLLMATGSTGGTYFPLGGEIAQIWSDNLDDVNVSTQASGASVENMRLLDSGENQLVMAVNGTAATAVDGTGDFEDDPLENPDDIRMLGNIYGEVMQVVTTEDAEIESIEDLDGARVEIGPPGSATEVLAQDILDAYGVEPAETFDSAFGDAATNLGDGQVDAAFGILGVPTGSVEELAASQDIVMLPIDGDPLDELMANDETLATYEIPADAYTGLEEDVQTVTNWATLYATAALDEDTAYDLVRVMYEQAGDIEHEVGGDLQLDTATDTPGPIEFHPGAERFFEEEGVL
jgi:uncharacterized protein